jgi:tRNA (cytidine/uridine-2'-O-)-methyltransferase
MFHVVLHQPEIPPNTGNIMRMCANSGARLHLVKPLGFTLEEKQLIRAGLDYRDMAVVTVHEDWPNCRAGFCGPAYFCTDLPRRAQLRRGGFRAGRCFCVWFGIPWLAAGTACTEFGDDRRLRIPMRPGNRSLNLSNAAAVVVYEAWRQNRI